MSEPAEARTLQTEKGGANAVGCCALKEAWSLLCPHGPPEGLHLCLWRAHRGMSGSVCVSVGADPRVRRPAQQDEAQMQILLRIGKNATCRVASVNGERGA